MEWIVSKDKVEYETAVATMEKRVANIRAGTESEAVWLVEHPPLYTAGTSAKDADLLNAPFPVYQTGRGGQYTYHGPGQRVAYVMLDLQKRAKGKQADVRRYVFDLEEWIIQSLALLGVRGERRQGRIGIWVDDHGTEKKIAAIGVRVRSGVTYHGIAINVDCDVSHYGGIVPCGISEFGVTSLKDLGVPKTMQDVDDALHTSFPKIFRRGN